MWNEWPLKLEMPGDARHLRPVKPAVGHHHEPGLHGVVATSRDQPAGLVLEPGQGADLGGVAILLPGNVADLPERRRVDVALDVALDARVAVPALGATKVAALLDDADAADPGLAQAGGGQQPTEAAADHQYVQLVGQARAREAGFDVGVVD